MGRPRTQENTGLAARLLLLLKGLTRQAKGKTKDGGARIFWFLMKPYFFQCACLS